MFKIKRYRYLNRFSFCIIFVSFGCRWNPYQHQNLLYVSTLNRNLIFFKKEKIRVRNFKTSIYSVSQILINERIAECEISLFVFGSWWREEQHSWDLLLCVPFVWRSLRAIKKVPRCRVPKLKKKSLEARILFKRGVLSHSL